MASYQTLVIKYMKATSKDELDKSFTDIQNKLRSEVGELCSSIENVQKIITTLKGSIRVLN